VTQFLQQLLAVLVRFEQVVAENHVEPLATDVTLGRLARLGHVDRSHAEGRDQFAQGCAHRRVAVDDQYPPPAKCRLRYRVFPNRLQPCPPM